MRKIFLLFSLCLPWTLVTGQNQDTSLITIKDFRLQPGTHSWRGTNTFHDMTSWGSLPYTEGHLQQRSGSNWRFRMNYRLLLPQSYDDDYSPGYPIVLFLHGAGERGNCWDVDCYCEGCDPNDPPVPDTNPQFLNNDHQLLFGGQNFLTAVNLAGSKKPNDPSLNAKAFPGFVLFPQNENTWGSASQNNSPISHAVRVLRLVMKQYNIDPDRVYVVGLSVGGQGALKALNLADWLFAASIAMSPINYANDLEYDSVASIPLWVFQGGNDLNPRPAETENLIRKFREAGGNVRYTFYPEAGHNTWTQALREPDFFSWLLKRTKAQIRVRYDNPNVCATNGAGAELMLAEGFPAYQWEFNGTVIPDSTRASLIADKPGTYRARFSRVPSPTASDWNEWSSAVVINEKVPPSTELTQIGTTYLKDLNGGNEAILKGPEGKAHYYWYRNGVLTERPDSIYLTLRSGNCGSPCSNTGQYTLVTADFDNCPSFPSSAKRVFFSDQAPVKNGMRPTSFTAEALSSSEIFLTWSDPSKEETAFEVWRLNTSMSDAKWQMAGITQSDVTFLKDTMLVPNSIYYYKIRALNHTARSDYFPGNNKTDEKDNLVVVTTDENDRPLPPQNLIAQRIGANSVKLIWNSGKDESGLSEYIVDWNNNSVSTGNLDTTFVIKGLTINSTYTISVRAVDISENTSAPSNQIVVHTNMNGLFYKHSTGAWKSLDESSIKSTWETPERTGSVENFSLSPRVQEDYFNFEFEGYLYIDSPGEYTFYLNSNEGSRLFIDGTQVVDFNGTHGTCTGNSSSTTCPNSWGRPSAKIQLTAGPHLIRVQYFEYTGSQALQVRYRGPDTDNRTISIPDEALTSGSYSPPSPPSIPGDLDASSNGLTGIRLDWDASSGSGVSYEIYRAIATDGPYVIIDRISERRYDDFSVTPGKTYYYKLKAVNANGSSGFSNVSSARTQNDSQAPSQPQGLVAQSGNFIKTILRWNSSSDNVGVAGYEVWANGQLIGTTDVPAFIATHVNGEVSTFYVVAFDAAGNRSSNSATVTNENLVTDVEGPITGNFAVSVYPNPGVSSRIKIKISSDTPEPVTIEIRDGLSRQIIEETVQPENFNEEYPLLGNRILKPGIYLLIVGQHGQFLHRKVLINN